MPPAMKTKTAAADTIGFMSKRDEDLITDISVLSDLGGSSGSPASNDDIRSL